MTSEQSTGFGARLSSEVAREKERSAAAAIDAQERNDRERKQMQDAHAAAVTK